MQCYLPCAALVALHLALRTEPKWSYLEVDVSLTCSSCHTMHHTQFGNCSNSVSLLPMSHVRILTSVAASVAYLGHQSRVITTGLKEHTAFSLPNWFKQPPVHSVPPKGVCFRAKWKSVFIEILATCPPYSETTVSTSSRKDSVGSSILFNGLLQALPQRAKKKEKEGSSNSHKAAGRHAGSSNPTAAQCFLIAWGTAELSMATFTISPLYPKAAECRSCDCHGETLSERNYCTSFLASNVKQEQPHSCFVTLQLDPTRMIESCTNELVKAQQRWMDSVGLSSTPLVYHIQVSFVYSYCLDPLIWK